MNHEIVLNVHMYACAMSSEWHMHYVHAEIAHHCYWMRPSEPDDDIIAIRVIKQRARSKSAMATDPLTATIWMANDIICEFFFIPFVLSNDGWMRFLAVHREAE